MLNEHVKRMKEIYDKFSKIPFENVVLNGMKNIDDTLKIGEGNMQIGYDGASLLFDTEDKYKLLILLNDTPTIAIELEYENMRMGIMIFDDKVSFNWHHYEWEHFLDEIFDENNILTFDFDKDMSEFERNYEYEKMMDKQWEERFY